jgi:nicotinamidase-related amidase
METQLTDGPQKTHGLRFGALGEEALHLCVDMQKLFAAGTEWATPWMERVLPNVVTLIEHRPEDLAFTRFIPLEAPEDGAGTWKRYYERWRSMLRPELDPGLLDLLDPLSRYTPPAPVFDKTVYSPWWQTDLHARLQAGGRNTLVITGGETEVCVLATVIGAVDLGYRVILATDALCSSADETHDAMNTIYHDRFGMQVETADIAEIMAAWTR